MSRNNAIEFLQETFDGCYNNLDTIKRVAGVINYVVEDSHETLADVQIDTKHLIMLNKTGEILEEGDHVWVYYWDSVVDGYIAIRCGEAKNIGGGIKNAGVLTEQQDTVYDIAKEVVIVDTENKAKAYYTNINNVILIDKYTAVAMTDDTYPAGSSTIGWDTDTDGAIELKTRIANMNSRLWSNKIKSYWIPNNVTGFVSGNEYTYYLQISSVTFTTDTPLTHQCGWVYRIGVFCQEVPIWYSAVDARVVTETPTGLEDCGLITLYSSLNAPSQFTSGSFGNKPTAIGALAVCAGANSNLYAPYYPSGETTPSYRKIEGLVVAYTPTTIALYNIDEYNYAIALTTERDIISSNV